MDYPVLNKAPDVASAVAIGYLDGSGNFVPIDSSHPLYVQLTGAPSTAQTVDLTKINGTAVSGSNPLYVRAAGTEYETVAASQTDQVLGATGATGDYLSHLVIQPATTGAGTVTVKDGTTVIF